MQKMDSRSPQSTEQQNVVKAVVESISVVRRLTSLECERLQGFPDNYTNIPGASDAKRYAALGNSMTVQVMAWVGQRIQLVENALEVINDL